MSNIVESGIGIGKMKRYGFLFEKIVDLENIKKAILRAARGKRKKHSVQVALEDIDKTAIQIQSWLVSGEWQPPRYHKAKIINDGIQLKKRIIVCPEFVREQCVHHAIMNVVYPLFQKRFYELSCGSVRGRGTHSAQKWISKKIRNKKNIKYYTKLDIQKFFQNIHPSFVFKELRKVIKDKRVLILFSRILRSNTVNQNGIKYKHGILIGFYTSPFFANVMLNALDHKSKEEQRVKYYIRYMDDILILGSNKRKIKKYVYWAKVFLNKIKLSVKKNQIHSVKIFEFLGYIFRKDKTTLSEKLFLKSKRCFKKIYKYKHLSLYQSRKVLSYCGYFKSCNMTYAFKKYISPYVSVAACKKIIQRNDLKGVLQ